MTRRRPLIKWVFNFIKMTRKEKCELAIKKGFTYDELTGKITTPSGVESVRKSGNGYNMITIRDHNRKQKDLYAHHFGWYFKYKEVVDLLDHINRVKTDNRISNLRSVTKSQNAMNMSNTKGYTYCSRTKKYIAIIMTNYKKKHLGVFETPQEARNCYLENKNIYHNINN